ncbi:hypothetical protein CDPG_00061 [Cellulophaga phage phi47:1]|nr:hypothetical protein CDPG_00061 [Cellulophaga phage phi47:1]
MQVIDGEHIEDPFDDTGKAQGNNIVKGIEINSKGEYVAFWVSNKSESSNELLNGMIGHTRIEAVNSNGNLVAWMMYGDKARIDHHREALYQFTIKTMVSQNTSEQPLTELC